MKPYLLVLYNKIRFYIKKTRIREFETNGLQMITRNSKLCFGKNSHIYFGDRLINDGRMVMIVEEGAQLYIGNHVYFNEEAMISCKRKIEIGNGCKFGPNVKIFDNNHKFDAVNGVSNAHSVGEIVIGEMGKKLGVNSSYLSQLFHKVEGMTIQQYIREEKIRLAQNMLRYSEYEIKEISNYLSFCSQSYLEVSLRHRPE